MKLVVATCVLAACGGAPARDLRNTATQTPTDGCPTANDVWLVTSEAVGGPERWLLPLHHEMLDSDAGVAEFTKLDEASARAHHVPVPPAHLWLLVPDQPPCEATPAGYYAELISEGPVNHTFGVELQTTCAIEHGLAVAVASPTVPASCKALVASDVATRLGGSDTSGNWQRPTKQTAIPPQLSRALAPHACSAPDCEALWAVGAVKDVAYEVTRNWIMIPRGSTPDHQCEWDQQREYDIFLVQHGIPTRLELADDEGGHHLFAILADARGPRVIVTSNIGEYATFDWANPPHVARYLKWMQPNDEDYASQGVLGPYCGP